MVDDGAAGAVQVVIGPVRHRLRQLTAAQHGAVVGLYGAFIADASSQREADADIAVDCELAMIHQADLSRLRETGFFLTDSIGPIEGDSVLPGNEGLPGGFLAALSPSPETSHRLYLVDPLDIGRAAVIENYLRPSTALALVNAEGCLLHSGGFVWGGKAWLYAGVSGAGKTTLTRHAHAAGAAILSDDINLLYKRPDGNYAVAPVPFAGDFGRSANLSPDRCSSVPLGGIFRLEKGDAVRVQTLKPSVQYATLLANSPFVNSRTELASLLDRAIEGLLASHAVRRLTVPRELNFSELVAHLPEECEHVS